MKGILFFLGGLFAVFLIALTVFFWIRRKIRRYSGHLFGAAPSAVLQNIQVQEEKPKSLNGMDTVFLPQILKDFPDFNPSLAETYVKEKLAQVCAGKPGFRVHNVVISGYDRARTEKTVVYQAALEYREKGVLRQKRYCLRYASLLPDDSGAALALNCPNCGAPLSDAGETVCTYCGSPLVQVMKHTWRFTEVFEK